MFSKLTSTIKGAVSHVKEAVSNEAPADPYIGTEHTIGKYTVIVEKILAQGGFATVYLSKDASGKAYALKKILALDAESRRCNDQEIRVMEKFRDRKYIVTMFASEKHRTPKGLMEYLLLMELCPGGHLVDWMNARIDNRPSEREILKIFADVCLGLEPLHQASTPIIHRDIKLENVLAVGSMFKLCDFGSATTEAVMPGEKVSIPMTEEEIQKYTTIQYRAPEMCDLYMHKLINTKADIWAMGCLLYKLCYFDDAFGESTLAIIGGKYKIPDAPKYSPSMMSLIAGMLQTDPDQRLDVIGMTQQVFQLLGTPCPIKGTAPTRPAAKKVPASAAGNKRKDSGSWADFGGASIPAPKPDAGQPRKSPFGAGPPAAGGKKASPFGDDPPPAKKKESPFDGGPPSKTGGPSPFGPAPTQPSRAKSAPPPKALAANGSGGSANPFGSPVKTETSKGAGKGTGNNARKVTSRGASRAASAFSPFGATAEESSGAGSTAAADPFAAAAIPAAPVDPFATDPFGAKPATPAPLRG